MPRPKLYIVDDDQITEAIQLAFDAGIAHTQVLNEPDSKRRAEFWGEMNSNRQRARQVLQGD